MMGKKEKERVEEEYRKLMLFDEIKKTQEETKEILDEIIKILKEKTKEELFG